MYITHIIFIIDNDSKIPAALSAEVHSLCMSVREPRTPTDSSKAFYNRIFKLNYIKVLLNRTIALHITFSKTIQ